MEDKQAPNPVIQDIAVPGSTIQPTTSGPGRGTVGPAQQQLPSQPVPPQPVVAPQATYPTPLTQPPSKSFLTAFLFALFLGSFGIDRFYLGKIGTGILKLLTFGGFGLWAMIDVILVLSGHTTAKDGTPLGGYRQRLKAALIIFIAWLMLGAGLGAMGSLLFAHHTSTCTSGCSVTAKNTGQANSTTQTTQTNPNTTTSDAQSVIDKFIGAMQANNKPLADSLQTPAFSQSNQQQSNTTSFYSSCMSFQTVCTYMFAKTTLASETKSTKTYVAADDTKGVEDVFATSQESTNGNASSSSATTLQIAAIPSGNTWLIDYVTFSSGGGGSSSL